MGRNKQVTCRICLRVMRSDNLKRYMKVHMKRNEAHPTSKRKLNDMDDVIEYEQMNSLLCPCDKCIHWEKYEECKICNFDNTCSNEEEMKEYHK